MFIRQVTVNIEGKADITKTNRGLLFDTERTFEIKIAFGSDTVDRMLFLYSCAHALSTDIPQMTSKFREIVLPFHRQGN